MNILPEEARKISEKNNIPPDFLEVAIKFATVRSMMNDKQTQWFDGCLKPEVLELVNKLTKTFLFKGK